MKHSQADAGCWRPGHQLWLMDRRSPGVLTAYDSLPLWFVSLLAFYNLFQYKRTITTLEKIQKMKKRKKYPQEFFPLKQTQQFLCISYPGSFFPLCVYVSFSYKSAVLVSIHDLPCLSDFIISICVLLHGLPIQLWWGLDSFNFLGGEKTILVYFQTYHYVYK